jgi:hypothetical protein
MPGKLQHIEIHHKIGSSRPPHLSHPDRHDAQFRQGELMDVMTIFAIQFLMSLVVWGSLAYWLLTPWLEKKSLNEALFFLTVPHAFRHIGMVFLVPGVVAGPLPETFAAPAALGDLLTGVLAFLALIALRNNWSVARAAVWLFSIVGTIDLINALRQGDAWMTNFGATWYIPTMLVPLLLVTQIMIFFRLFRGAAKFNTVG